MILQLLHLPLHLFAAAKTECPLGGSACDTGLPTTGATSSNLQSLLQAAFGIIGVIAVVMLVIGGLQFITAQGDPSGVVRARKIMVYALGGLLVAVSAEAIVTFVISKL
jgi:hypothetical protein